MIKNLVRTGAVLSLILSVTVGLGSSAEAADICNTPVHCYATEQGYNGANIADAVAANVTYKCMTGSAGVFTTQEVWIGTGDRTNNQWMEAGIGNGQGDGYVSTAPTYFWARQANDTGYQEFPAFAWGAAPKNTPINFAIIRGGAFAWTVHQGGRILGNANTPTTTMFQTNAGAESNYHGLQNSGTTDRIQTKWNGSSTWIAGIGYSATLVQVPRSGYYSIPSHSATGLTYSVPSVAGSSGC